MLHWEVSVLPLIVVALTNFILSWLYYSPATPWFRAWQTGVGVDPNKREMTEEDKKFFPILMLSALVSTFLFAYGLQVVVHSAGVTDLVGGALVGLVAWVGFSVTHSLSTLFEGRKPLVLVINQGLHLITYVGYGALVAVWR